MRERARSGLDLLAVGVATAAFLALWIHRFLGLTLDGYFLEFGKLVASGAVPYRDFHLYVPPVEPVLNALLFRSFGPSLLAPRLLGAALRIVLALLLAATLRRFASRRVAAFAAVAAIVLSAADTTEVLLLYNFDSILAALAAAWALARGVDDPRRAPRWSTLAGALAGLSFGTKQTVGLLAIVALGIVAVLEAERGRRVRTGCAFGAGVLVVPGTIAVWLSARGALGDAIDQIFRGAVAAKGPVLALWERAASEMAGNPVLRWPALAALVGVVVVARYSWRSPGAVAFSRFEPGDAATGLGGAVLACAGIGLAVVGAVAIASPRLGALRFAERVAAAIGLLWCTLTSVRTGIRAISGRWSAEERALLPLAAAGAAIGWGLSFSWGLHDGMALPGFALFLVAALAPASAGGLPRPVRSLAWAAAILAIACGAWARFAVPYEFAGRKEPPIFAAKSASALPQLAGFRLAPATAQEIEAIVALVRAHSREGDPVLAFPDLPIVNLLADRPPATFALVHWFDVCPDAIVAADVARLEASPPAVIVRLDLPEAEIRAHELAFREGGKSALRDMVAQLDRFTSTYRLVGTFDDPSRGDRITVWSRPDR